MGIQVEFNPDLALRNIREYHNKNRTLEECIPEDLVVGETYPFLKHGHRNYWFDGEIPLLETKGDGNLSRPKAAILMIEATHFMKDGMPFTRGFYKVIDVYSDNDTTTHFESYRKLD